jgi:hypothetical protein
MNTNHCVILRNVWINLTSKLVRLWMNTAFVCLVFLICLKSSSINLWTQITFQYLSYVFLTSYLMRKWTQIKVQLLLFMNVSYILINMLKNTNHCSIHSIYIHNILINELINANQYSEFRIFDWVLHIHFSYKPMFLLSCSIQL